MCDSLGSGILYVIYGSNAKEVFVYRHRTSWRQNNTLSILKLRMKRRQTIERDSTYVE
jgi:hypothetical protein